MTLTFDFESCPVMYSGQPVGELEKLFIGVSLYYQNNKVQNLMKYVDMLANVQLYLCYVRKTFLTGR